MDLGRAERAQSSLDRALHSDLEKLREGGLFRSFRTIASAQGRTLVVDGRECLNFCSNDYLGLANDPVLRQAAGAAVQKYGVGAGGSRLVCGNLEPYAELERALANLKQKESAIVFASGYAANVGTICALVGKGDTVIIDKLCHASIIDGCRQSGATIRVYPHGSMAKLEALLKQAHPSPIANHQPRVLVITDTVFSMDGDLAPLPELVALKARYGAWLMIDEAHATGVFGMNGCGLAEHYGLADHIEVTLGTLSKAIGCLGGYVAGSQVLIDWLRNQGRSLIYSTGLPPSVCAAATAAIHLLKEEEGRRRRAQLWANVQELWRLLSTAGVKAESASPIIPIVIGAESRTVEASQRLWEQGIFVSAVRYPTVLKGRARLRITVTAAHTRDDLLRLAHTLASLLQRL